MGWKYSILCSFELHEIDPEDPTSCWTIVIRPARMNAGIAANEGAIVHGKSVRIGRAGNELHRLKHFAVCQTTRCVNSLALAASTKMDAILDPMAVNLAVLQ